MRKPLEHVGQVTLKPLDLTAVKGLELNADAAGGEVRVEVLNTEGKRLRGFTRDDAIAIRGDSLRHSLGWQGRGVTNLPPGTYMLRLHLNHATVYALRVNR